MKYVRMFRLNASSFLTWLTFSYAVQSASPSSRSIPWFSHAESAPGVLSQCWTLPPPVNTCNEWHHYKSLQKKKHITRQNNRQSCITLASISSTFSLASCSMKAIMCLICQKRQTQNSLFKFRYLSVHLLWIASWQFSKRKYKPIDPFQNKHCVTQTLA